MTIELRPEQPGDEEAIDVVNCQAFSRMVVPGHQRARLVNR